MARKVRWIDLLDPDEARLRAETPRDLHPQALERLAARETAPQRPTLQAHGDYILGVFLVPVAVPEEDRVFYQEVGLVLTRHTVVAVRKTPTDGAAFDPAPVREACRHGIRSPGLVVYHLVDEIAEHFLDLLDSVNTEIDELDDRVDDLPAERVRARLTELRQDLLAIRTTLAPTRDAVRKVVDDRVELDRGEAFPREVELYFRDAYDKLLRAGEGLELSRDLLAGVRDYHQAKIASDQNDVMRRLTVVASLLLLPTFIVGVYGQNFEHKPELNWDLDTSGRGR